MNKESKRLYDMEYRQKNKEKIAYKKKIYAKENLVKLRAYRAEYDKKNSNKVRINKKRYQDKIESSNSNQKIAMRLRSRMNSAFRIGAKGGSAVRDLGCSLDFFKIHIENLFKPGMSWENWGLGPKKWHFDHIVPLSGFDLSNRDQFLKACNYINIQPLWQFENLSKGFKK